MLTAGSCKSFEVGLMPRVMVRKSTQCWSRHVSHDHICLRYLVFITPITFSEQCGCTHVITSHVAPTTVHLYVQIKPLSFLQDQPQSTVKKFIQPFFLGARVFLVFLAILVAPDTKRGENLLFFPLSDTICINYYHLSCFHLKELFTY